MGSSPPSSAFPLSHAERTSYDVNGARRPSGASIKPPWNRKADHKISMNQRLGCSSPKAESGYGR